MEIISFLILIWLIFIFDFKLELENKCHSNDIPMKWILLKIEPVLDIGMIIMMIGVNIQKMNEKN